MTSMGTTATEVLQHGRKQAVKVDMGTFTASSDIIWDGGLQHEDNSTGRRLGTYATPVRPGDLVKIDTTVNDDEIVVKRMAASDNGSLLFGILVSLRGKAGDTLWEGVVYVPGHQDILEFVSGADADATDIDVGDKVSLDADAYSATRVHGFTVKKDATNGIGYVLNKITDDGEVVRVMIKHS